MQQTGQSKSIAVNLLTEVWNNEEVAKYYFWAMPLKLPEVWANKYIYQDFGGELHKQYAR